MRLSARVCVLQRRWQRLRALPGGRPVRTAAGFLCEQGLTCTPCSAAAGAPSSGCALIGRHVRRAAGEGAWARTARAEAVGMKPSCTMTTLRCTSGLNAAWTFLEMGVVEGGRQGV